MADQRLNNVVLREIDTLLKRGVLPVHNEHLKHLREDGDILEQLIFMKKEGLISGDIISIGKGKIRPHRMTNIRLTILGIRALKS